MSDAIAPQLAGAIGERHRIIANDWQSARSSSSSRGCCAAGV